VFESSEESLKSPSPLPWLDGVALRDLVLHETHAACVDARGDVYQWGNVFAQGSVPTKPIRTLRGKVRGLGFAWPVVVYRSFQDIKQLAINRDKVVALSQTGDIFVLSTADVQPVSSSSSFRFWDAGDTGGAVGLKPREALKRGEKLVLLPRHVSDLH
jgi:hypothetical protein